MARFGPRADGPPIFGPGQAGPIYKRKTGPIWADGPSRAPKKPARAGPKRAGPRPDTSLVIKLLVLQFIFITLESRIIVTSRLYILGFFQIFLLNKK